MSKVILVLVFLHSSISLAQPAPLTCTPGCRDGFSCLDGACVSACNPLCGAGETCIGSGPGVCRRSESTTPAALAAAPLVFAPPAVPSIDNSGSLHVNLLGFLQLGPTVSLELGGRTTFSARARFMNAGALSYVIIADTADDEVLGFSYGAAGVLRRYYGTKGNMRGFYVGGGVEYISTHVEEQESVAYDTQLLLPQVEIGFRWVSGNFMVEVGGALGYLIVMTAASEPLREAAPLFENDASNQVGGTANLSVGMVF